MKKFLIACFIVVALAAATQAMAQDPNYTVKPGDMLSISVWKEPDLQRPALVRPDGAFSFPLVGEVDAKGKTVADLTKTLSQRLARYISDPVVTVSIQEIRHPELNAQLQAEKIAQQLEKRIAFRRAMKKTMEESQRFGAQGIKVMIAGRLNGAEIARTEWSLQGRLPLHTLRADIDYGFAEALTTFGIIGIKVWIYRGDILSNREAQEASRVKPKEG